MFSLGEGNDYNFTRTDHTPSNHTGVKRSLKLSFELTEWMFIQSLESDKIND